jgi:predicted small lipoprotein YifL
MSRVEQPALGRVWRGAAARLVLVLLIAVTVAACGKKGDPKPPADQPINYPKQYPSE